ncbi:hypothetical protein [Bradyrhizobium sp. I1.7.5]|uniref:hypothetical protein n=1 Tax=Bradyrhizobium sp. I1.7.5 TaxID=3156363 RepID=UPI003392A778
MPNIYSRDLRNAILEAAHNVGDGEKRKGLVAFLEDAARYHKKAFCSLLAKSLPFSISAEPGSAPVVSVSIVTVPSGMHLSPADATRLAVPAALIEHEATQQPEPELIHHEVAESEPALSFTPLPRRARAG